MLNLSMLKLIKHLTTKSKGLRWGTGYLILFLLLRRDQLSLTTGEGGWRTLEDHMTFGGKGREISRRRQSLK